MGNSPAATRGHSQDTWQLCLLIMLTVRWNHNGLTKDPRSLWIRWTRTIYGNWEHLCYRWQRPGKSGYHLGTTLEDTTNWRGYASLAVFKNKIFIFILLSGKSPRSIYADYSNLILAMLPSGFRILIISYAFMYSVSFKFRNFAKSAFLSRNISTPFFLLIS